MTPPLNVLAYHEAGHVVMAWLRQVPIERGVTLHPGVKLCWKVLHPPRWHNWYPRSARWGEAQKRPCWQVQCPLMEQQCNGVAEIAAHAQRGVDQLSGGGITDCVLIRPEDATDDEARRYIDVAVAGPVAEERYAGHFDHNRAKGDLDAEANYRESHASEANRDPWEQVRAELADRATWAMIEAVANELLTRPDHTLWRGEAEWVIVATQAARH